MAKLSAEKLMTSTASAKSAAVTQIETQGIVRACPRTGYSARPAYPFSNVVMEIIIQRCSLYLCRKSCGKRRGTDLRLI